jgi:coproporphyrinogen III oxidase
MRTLPVQTVREYFLGLQSCIVDTLERADGAQFQTDVWERPEGGGGISRLLEGGQLFERAGVLFSHVKGVELPPSASVRRPELVGRPWEAMGLSLVLHPRNPFIPTVHLNVRMFVAQTPSGSNDQADVFWFGGGMDLTPYYAFEEDALHFHRTCHAALSHHGDAYYPRFKKCCDDYFFLKHRNEARGIGGIFFDDLNEEGFDKSFALVSDVGNAFLPAYMPIVARRRDLRYGARERSFQAYRRGRYVEFNLVFDRGTLFGLQSGGRTESILLSMPPEANWRYNWHPEAGSPEAELAAYLVPRDWV